VPNRADHAQDYHEICGTPLYDGGQCLNLDDIRFQPMDDFYLGIHQHQGPWVTNM
jgi:hypothetical protein